MGSDGVEILTHLKRQHLKIDERKEITQDSRDHARWRRLVRDAAWSDDRQS